MPDFNTARHKLPLLAVAQAQKEITHNEALVRIDALLHPVVQDELAIPPVASDADIGKCWLVAASPSGEWTGNTGQIAVWVGGSWRFCAAADGMRIRQQSLSIDRIRSGGGWVMPPVISNPINGSVVDIEARAAIASLLSYLRTIGLVTN